MGVTSTIMESQRFQALPPGYLEQYTGNECVDVGIAFSILEIFSMSVRLCTRVRMDKAFGMDDWPIIPALACCLGICSLEFICEFHHHHFRALVKPSQRFMSQE